MSDITVSGNNVNIGLTPIAGEIVYNDGDPLTDDIEVSGSDINITMRESADCTFKGEVNIGMETYVPVVPSGRCYPIYNPIPTGMQTDWDVNGLGHDQDDNTCYDSAIDGFFWYGGPPVMQFNRWQYYYFPGRAELDGNLAGTATIHMVVELNGFDPASQRFSANFYDKNNKRTVPPFWLNYVTTQGVKQTFDIPVGLDPAWVDSQYYVSLLWSWSLAYPDPHIKIYEIYLEYDLI